MRFKKMDKSRSASIITVAALALTLVTAGCNKKETASQESNAAESSKASAPATPIDPTTVASVSGVVKFEGVPPKPTKIDMSQDPACSSAEANMTQTVVADGGDLSNVFVYVKDGLADRTFDPPKDPVTIDQHGCRYIPHVLGVMAGQPIKIVNSDNTTHNIHPSPTINREWNESQAPKSAPLDKSFPREEIMMQVKCNQHPWMKMFVNVSKNPFFAVTDKDGKFEIKGLPPGEYTIAARQEKLGEQTMKVTVAAKNNGTANFTFKQ